MYFQPLGHYIRPTTKAALLQVAPQTPTRQSNPIVNFPLTSLLPITAPWNLLSRTD